MDDNHVIEGPTAEEFPMYGVYRDEQLQNEGFVDLEISQLWMIHNCCASDIKSEQYRQRAVGNSLGELLHVMKGILASPGRMGRWSGWLKEHKIPRASADRMVNRYVEAFHLSSESPRDAIEPEPTEAEIGRLFAALWGRMEKTLTTQRSRYEFLRCFLYRSGLVYDWREDSILAYEPGSEPVRAATAHDADSTTHCLSGDSGDVL
jgi:hypothetical protein